MLSPVMPDKSNADNPGILPLDLDFKVSVIQHVFIQGG